MRPNLNHYKRLTGPMRYPPSQNESFAHVRKMIDCEDAFGVETVAAVGDCSTGERDDHLPKAIPLDATRNVLYDF